MVTIVITMMLLAVEPDQHAFDINSKAQHIEVRASINASADTPVKIVFEGTIKGGNGEWAELAEVTIKDSRKFVWSIPANLLEKGRFTIHNSMHVKKFNYVVIYRDLIAGMLDEFYAKTSV